jgi:hypothetical protein
LPLLLLLLLVLLLLVWQLAGAAAVTAPCAALSIELPFLLLIAVWGLIVWYLHCKQAAKAQQPSMQACKCQPWVFTDRPCNRWSAMVIMVLLAVQLHETLFPKSSLPPVLAAGAVAAAVLG